MMSGTQVGAIRAWLVSQAQGARLLPTGCGGRQGEGVPVPKHTLGMKANWCMLAMGKRSLEMRGAGLQSSLAVKYEMQQHCLFFHKMPS